MHHSPRHRSKAVPKALSVSPAVELRGVCKNKAAHRVLITESAMRGYWVQSKGAWSHSKNRVLLASCAMILLLN